MVATKRRGAPSRVAFARHERTWLKQIGRRLYEARIGLARHYGTPVEQHVVARALGIHQTTVSRHERGVVPMSLLEVQNYALIYSTPGCWLAFGCDQHAAVDHSALAIVSARRMKILPRDALVKALADETARLNEKKVARQKK